jgi:hypothetical protein
MKFKILLITFLLFSVFVRAQEPYQNLIFSEVRLDQAHHAYMELCNMGDVSVDLAQFEVGKISPWEEAYIPDANGTFRLPSHLLNPGETYVIAGVRDWGNKQALIDPESQGSNTKDDTWRIADLLIHFPESPITDDPTDSVTPGYGVFDLWRGNSCYFIRHHYTEVDSVVVDAVNGIFTGDDGQRPGEIEASDVAGVPDATVNSILVRKHSITNGNLDWEQARGVDVTDSEWFPVPIMVAGGFELGRKEYWTMGNHGDYKLEDLTSNTIEIDWTNQTLTANWGARNQDSLMNEFDYTPGIAWQYVMSANKIDSTFTSVRTGDSITLYACGDQFEIAKMGIIALPPSASEARVIPKNANNGGNWYTPYIVSENLPGMDTISEAGFATRVDSLYKYLEKADEASWEIIWVDDIIRPDLMNGDILKVTAEDGTTKEYYIKLEEYRPSHNANLASITWPDIPPYYKGIYGWMGDTIPKFSPTKFLYNVSVPIDAEGIPALIARPENSDTKVEVKRATSLFGSEEDRTIRFFTTAEDDTTNEEYVVILEKEKDLSKVQPNILEPFISQFVFRTNWHQTFIEICNPGNRPLDLSRYCLVRGDISLSPAEAITASSTIDDWASRFNRYVPGYIWQDEASWQVQPGILEEDFSGLSTTIEGGDVFVIAFADPLNKDSGAPFPYLDEVDVNFHDALNPWGIELGMSYENNNVTTSYNCVAGGWTDNSWYLYKIINDSVLNGDKPLVDPYDVEIVDVFGNCDVTNPGNIDGSTYEQNSGMLRYPEYYIGNTEPGGSFGDGTTGAEWLYTNSSYWETRDYGWPDNNTMNAAGIGSHEMVTITDFISTVNSSSYAVSDGFEGNQTIGGGVQEGISVDEFLSKIIIPDEEEVLTFTSGGIEISGDDLLTDGDLLTVVSANGKNTTQYTINVTAEGLDNNALLTSSDYTIEVEGASGTISGFEIGATLREVYDNCTAPTNVSMYGAFKADDSYAAFTEMTLDSVYRDVLANDQIYFEVTAQDGATRIVYQLVPNSLATDAYVLSTVYDIDQEVSMIKLIHDGTNVSSLFNNLIPAPGATLVLENNAGQIREQGSVYEDDIIVVTAQDGTTQRVYTLEMYSDFEARYNASLFSEVWTVNQQGLRVDGPVPTTTVEEFLSEISISIGATFVLVDADGNLVSTGNMNDDFKVIVTSENGIITNIYRVVIDITGISTFDGESLKIYPNPTSGAFVIDGVEEGNTVKIFNTNGNVVLTFKASSTKQRATLNNQPAGLYMVIVNNGSQNVANFKIIKQ